MWTRTDYERAGNKIGKDFVSGSSTSSINDLATKVAADNKLTPEGIRTVVRLANVSAFENVFSKSAGNSSPDRMVEFEVGDPEVVISKLHKTATEKHTVKEASDYNRNLDYFGDMPKDTPPLEKTASAIPGVGIEAPVSATVSRAHVHMQFKRADDRMREQGLQAKAVWENNIEKAAQSMRVLDNRVDARTFFEKEAVASLGDVVTPELYALRYVTSPGTPKMEELCGGEKIASVIESHVAHLSQEHVPIIEMIKEARAAREYYAKCTAGREWIASNMDKVN